MTDTREIRLPGELCAAAEKKFASRFGSLEELLVCVLRELLRDDAARLERAEQQLLDERLRELGYL